MTQHDAWDEKTPVPGIVPRLRAVEARADVQEFTISEVGAEVKKLRAEVAEARMAAARDRRADRVHFDQRLDRIEFLARGAYRKAEDSSNNLDEFGRELEKAKKFMKWPTALVCVALIAAYVILARFDAVPSEVKQLVGAVAIVGAAAMPALAPALVDKVRAILGLTPKPPTGGAS